MGQVYGRTTTWAPNTSPAPKPICSASPPESSGCSSSSRCVASGIEADDVLPGRLDVAGDDHGVRQLEQLRELVDDAHVRLVRDERGEVGAGDAGGVEGLRGDLGHVPDGPAEHGLAFLAERRPCGRAVAVVDESRVHADRIRLRAVRAPDRRGDAGRLARADDRGAGAVAEQERDACGRSGRRRRTASRTDHEGVVRGAAADERIRLGDGVAVAGAGGVDVVCRCGIRADRVGDDGGHRRRLLHVADRGARAPRSI